MENRQQIILSEIKDLIASINRQVYDLENRFAELESLAEESGMPAPKPIDLDLDFVPEETLPAIGSGEGRPAYPESGHEEAEPVHTAEAEQEELYPSSEDSVAEPRDMHQADMDMQSPAEDKPSATPDHVVAVMDVLTAREAWRTDMPGTEVKDIRSAISLNDRLLFIKSLFGDDPALFLSTLDRLNSMGTLDEAADFIRSAFPSWDMDSEVVYRFMMAVRRKLR